MTGKGKKFDAAEKHFQKKEMKYKNAIKRYADALDASRTMEVHLSEENKRLSNELEEIKLKYEKILEYSKLSDVDIKEAIQKDKSMNALASFITTASRFMR